VAVVWWESKEDLLEKEDMESQSLAAVAAQRQGKANVVVPEDRVAGVLLGFLRRVSKTQGVARGAPAALAPINPLHAPI
jgi:hypothetical protein